MIQYGPEQATETEADEDESPDPLGLNPTDSFEVKQESLEVLEERRIKVVPRKSKSTVRRPYTNGEVSLIPSFRHLS